jgi:hypothetical protein
MRISTSAAAANLGISVPHLFQHLAEIDRSLPFEGIWPEIDEDWIKSVSQMGLHFRSRVDSHLYDASSNSTISALSGMISQVSRRILDKLVRRRKWGHSSVSFEALLNLTRLSAQDISRGLIELRKLGFLDERHDGERKGHISLNAAKRKEIEEAARIS